MCEPVFEVLTVIFLGINLGLVLYATSRYRQATTFLQFWISTAVFVAMGTILYFHVVSDCNMIYLKVVAAFMGLNFVILVVDCQVWLYLYGS